MIFVDAYRRISLFNQKIDVPKVPFIEDVIVHLIPNIGKDHMLVRMWWNNKLMGKLTMPLNGFIVHFSTFPTML
jgi:hypothetical protein